MFCSKCGNQVNDGAVFCCKCGYKLDGSIPVSQNTDNKNNSHQQSPMVAYVEQPRQNSVGIDSEEANKKLLAIVFFIVSGIMMLGAFIALIATRLSVIADLIETDYSHSMVERAFQNAYEESQGVIIFLFFAYVAYIIFQSFTLWTQYRKREFARNKKAVKINCGVDIISLLVISVLIGASLSDAISGAHFSLLYYVILMVIIVFKIIYAVLYCQAADYEEYLSEKESKAASGLNWKCEHCGHINVGSDTFCIKCENNRSR